MDHITLYICTVNVLQCLSAHIALRDNYHYIYCMLYRMAATYVVVMATIIVLQWWQWDLLNITCKSQIMLRCLYYQL